MSDFSKIMGSVFGGQKSSEAFVAAGVIAVVMMIIIPLPTFLLDLLMAVNLLIAIMTMLIVIYTKKALEFSIFPTLLLVSTVFGLGLNISSTRLILTMGTEFDGQIVRAFSRFVVGGNEGVLSLVIGVIIFIIIIVVQVVVITKGATRIAEVAARFTLDAMPGKQMAIDGAFQSGAITEEELKYRKKELEQEVEFYSQMDGASKFVSGNVKVGILVTFINVIGGIVVGMTIHGENFNTALNTYVSLTIGDGLVSQFPALLISTATGLLVARSNTGETMGADIQKQFGSQVLVYWISAAFIGILGVLPGFPTFIMLPLAALLAWQAYSMSRKEVRQSEADTKANAEAKPPPNREKPSLEPLDPLSMELGFGLTPLVDMEKGAELLDRITRIRRETALELGLVVPMIRIMDNMRLEPSNYCLKIKGVEVGKGTIRMGNYLAINPGGEREEIPGEKTVDPAFGLAALWVSEENRDKAERAGFTVVDAPSIIATHLTEILKKHAPEILGRQEVNSLLDTVKTDYPSVVEEVRKNFSLGEIQKVLQGLLREQVSIRNLVVILETLGDYGGVTKDVGYLVEKVRQALSRQICQQYIDENRVLRVLTIEPELEQSLIDSRDERLGQPMAALDPQIHRSWINAVANAFKKVQNAGHYPLILCSEAARPLVKQSTERDLSDLVVLSVPEVAPGIQVESLGEIRLEDRE